MCLSPTPTSQGLADEEFDLTDEDIGESGAEDEGEEDEEPILRRNGSAAHSNSQANGATPYGYRDVFGKEFESRRQKMIDLKVSGSQWNRRPCSTCLSESLGGQQVNRAAVRLCCCEAMGHRMWAFFKLMLLQNERLYMFHEALLSGRCCLHD